MSVIEAMLTGLPVVASDIRGPREQVEPGVTGLLVPARDPAPLAAALARLAGDPALRAAMGAAGRSRAMALYDEAMVVGRTAGPAGPVGLSRAATARWFPMPDILPIRVALISVSDKTGLLPFAAALALRGAEILSTGGTAEALRAGGIAVTEVSAHTGFPEILDGRVKTLVPQIHGGLLARRDSEAHLAQIRAHGIAPIDLVAVNLYPFEAALARGAAFEDCLENIDIGGPAMIRSAAKNHDFVTVLTEPSQYDAVLSELAEHGGTTHRLRRGLAGAAFARTAAYDSAIAGWLAAERHEAFPPRLTVAGTLRQTLRYGENPHQQAGFYVNGTRPGVATAEQVQGKELSFNNLNDTDAAFECVAEFDAPAVVIVKHANPCGVAAAGSLAAAWEAALRCDPVSAFGGIVAVNRTLDAAAAERIAAIFTEAIIAPDADEGARAVLAKKRNLRLLLTGGMPDPAAPRLSFRSVAGGFLAQSADTGRVAREDLRVVTKRAPEMRGDGRPAVRLPRLQARQVERHRLCPRRRDGGHRCRADEPGGQRADRRLEEHRGGEGRRSGAPAGRGQRGGVGRLLPLRRRAGGGGRGGGDGGDPARRLGARRRGDRGGRCRRRGDGLHRDAAFPALICGAGAGSDQVRSIATMPDRA